MKELAGLDFRIWTLRQGSDLSIIYPLDHFVLLCSQAEKTGGKLERSVRGKGMSSGKMGIKIRYRKREENRPEYQENE